MSATTRSRIWSRQSSSRVVESTLIGDGPHVQIIRHNRPHPPRNQRMLTAAVQSPRRNYLLRKISLQRSLAFCSRLRSTFGGPASGFGYLFDLDFSMSRPLRLHSHRPIFGNWAGLPNENYEEAEDVDIQQRRFFSERHHWDRAQLYFQQYLGLRQRHHLSPKSFSLKCELNLKFIRDALYELGLTEALRLAFNEMLHMH
ncbi:uncharacterized protein [Drosophila takahashii]|uniref:uncharacterized protein n=1 Tax=Drosophila takahashii TaxID=29030 RepID=UPI001CF908A1|nr:uncharacterized protein LOC108068211 [Drosophila takahashii]